MLPALIAVALAACLHWLPAPEGFQGGVVGLAWLGLLLMAGRPLFAPALLLALVETLSAARQGLPVAVLLGGALPWLSLAPMLAGWRAAREPWLIRAFWLGELLALHAVVCFLAFRWAGGGHRLRPEISSVWLKTLVWPYYCGHYPRGAHAIGLLLNDNNLGLWCLSLFLIGLVRLRRPGLCLGLAVLWSYSRAAALSLLCAVAWLAWRWDRRVLGLLLLLPLGFVSFATWLDRERFGSPLGPIAYPAERVYWVGRAFGVLAGGSLLGEGPGSARLVDSQWCKSAVELGWAGVLAWGYFWLQAWRGSRCPGMQSAVLALLMGGVGNDILYSPLLVGTLLSLGGLAWEQDLSKSVPISTLSSLGKEN